jgi:hypothetical protein
VDEHYQRALIDFIATSEGSLISLKVVHASNAIEMTKNKSEFIDFHCRCITLRI